jgi:hypothetical protein
MLTYADVCWRMLTYADVCWRMLTYAAPRCAVGLSCATLHSSEKKKKTCARAVLRGDNVGHEHFVYGRFVPEYIYIHHNQYQYQYIHRHMYMYTCVCACVCLCLCVCVCIHVVIYIYIYVYLYIRNVLTGRKYVCIRTRANTHTHLVYWRVGGSGTFSQYASTYMNIYLYTHIFIHTQTHKHALRALTGRGSGTFSQYASIYMNSVYVCVCVCVLHI